MESFNVKTPQNLIEVDYDFCLVSRKDIKTDKCLFDGLCKAGCPNYGKKYSCPPYSPKFENLGKDFDYLFVAMFCCSLQQINSGEYNKIRIANSVMKSRMDKLMRNVEKKQGGLFMSNGSCRLCRSCGLKISKPCKYPQERRYSLESTGIDVNQITEKYFKKKLLWYDKTKSKAPEYTCVVSAIFCNKDDFENLGKLFTEGLKSI
jgi:predicted metal-binding protein